MFHGELRITHFPYCLERQPDGRHVVLNRNYKPIGFFTADWVNYADHPVAVKIKNIGPKQAAALSYEGNPSVDHIYLYNDGCIPTRSAEHMQAYLQRLAALMTMKTAE